jgi:serine/threonine-protein kinase
MVPGMQLGRYELLEPIGSSGMGEVWKARDTRLTRIVAIKTLTRQHDQRFEQEARAVAALNHPYICQVHDVGPGYLVLEYIDGQPLPCPVARDEALPIAVQIASAIEAAHAKGIIHRDLKPANILMTRERSIKLLDFGLAKLVGDGGDATPLTLQGSVLGTVPYMSPEQAEGKALDERSDIFSFGAVLYEMLSGKRAFRGGTIAETLSAVLHQEPPALKVEPEWERIVRRCLAKQPFDRFQSMSDVRRALEGIHGRAVEQQPSVAVLPFTIISADKEDAYFGDGLAEEIINAIAQIPGLNVTARTSSFSFRGSDLDIRKVAQMLGVRTVLEGSVRRSGNRIRVTAQLISAENGYHLWSERYDREMADVFAIQDEIAHAIASALKVKLSPGAAVTRRHTPSIPAYEAFLRARYLIRKSTPQSLSQGKACLEQAIALDKNFALPHAELATYFSSSAVMNVLTAREALPQARQAAQRALAIDPALPEAHAELAAVALFLDYDWAVAGDHLRQAMARDPIPATVSHLYGFFYLLPQDRIQEAIAELKQALTDDPLNAEIRTHYAVCLWGAGRNDEASAQFSQVLEMDENFWLALFLYALWHATEGDVEAALPLAERTFAVAPHFTGSLGILAGLLSRTGSTERAKLLEKELGDGTAYGAPIGYVAFHMARREFDRIPEWAEKAIAQRDPNALPATAQPTRKYLASSGRWPALKHLLRL